MPATAADDWKFPLEQLSQTVRDHTEADERQFRELHAGVTEVKVDVGNIKGRMVVIAGFLVVMIPLVTTVATEIIHAFHHVP